MTDAPEESLDAWLERARELNYEGFDWGQAWGKAWLEKLIADWPTAWGEDLQILIYGDFEPPPEKLHFSELRITVYPEKLEDTIIRSATCVLKAHVEISEKSLPAVLDAASRINTLLGAWTLVEWGNGACGWWSHITSGSMGGVCPSLPTKTYPPQSLALRICQTRYGKKSMQRYIGFASHVIF